MSIAYDGRREPAYNRGTGDPRVAPTCHRRTRSVTDTLSETPLPSPQPANGSMLFGFWYPAMLSRDLHKGAIRAATLLGLPLAIGRGEDGRAFALIDRCPHRAMPLSSGRIPGSAVECC